MVSPASTAAHPPSPSRATRMMSHHLSSGNTTLLPRLNLDADESIDHDPTSASPPAHRHHPHRPALLEQRRDGTNGSSKLASVPYNAPIIPPASLSRVESNDSIHSSGATSSKTANFFASSPIAKNPSTSRSFISPRHARSGSSSSLRSPSAAPSQLLPPADLLRTPSSSSTASNQRTLLGEDHVPESSEGGSNPASRQGASSRRQQGRRPSSFRAAAVQLSSPSDYYDHSALSSAGSIRSRRNWDEFEGKPITPLPSPGIGQYEMDSRGSMFGDMVASGPHGRFFNSQTNDKDFSDSVWSRLPSANGNSSVVAKDDIPSGQTPVFLAAPDSSAINRDSFRRSLPSTASSDGSQHTGGDAALRSTEMTTRSVSKTKSFFATSHTPIPPVRTPVKAGDQAGHSRNISNQSGNSNASWDSPLGSANSLQSPWLALQYQSMDTSRSTDSVSLAEGLHHLTSPPISLWSKRPILTQMGSTSPSRVKAELKQSNLDSAAAPHSTDSKDCPQDSSLHDAGNPALPLVSQENIQSGPPFEFRERGSQAQGPSAALSGDSSRQRPLQSAERMTISDLPPLTTSQDARQHSDVEKLAPFPTPANAFSPGEVPMTRSEAVSHTDLAPQSPNTVMLSPEGRARSGTMLNDDVGVEESEDEATDRVGMYRVEKTLGVGAFSRVVLGRPLPPKLAPPPSSRSQSTAPSPSIDSEDSRDLPGDKDGAGKDKEAVTSRRRALQWPRPWRRSSSSHLTASAPPRSPSKGFRTKRTMSIASQASGSLQASLSSLVRSTSPHSERFDALEPMAGSLTVLDGEDEKQSELVALKMIQREPCDQNERMRVSWVREVEVLKHIEHPSLIKFVNAFSTPRHHVLVLERVAGGELFDLLSAHHSELAQREWLIRRLFAELANAVGWMHSIHLVHRDIKLENIILTRDLFVKSPSSTSLDLIPSALGPIPLLKLTDFGLSRFIDPNKALLETRCGSEEYAAPELIIGKKYDGRKTDCWAMGVVLYSLMCGGLPFVEGSPGTATSASSFALGSVAGDNSTSANLQMVTNHNTRENHRGAAEGQQTDPQRDVRKRKAHLLRIAKGDLRWPSKMNDESLDSPPATLCPPSNRLVTPFAKHIVARLLRRDANKRGSAWECFEDPWLTHGSFLSADGGERTSCGEVVELPPDPRTAEGAVWLSTRAYVRAGEVGPVAKVD